MNCPHKRRNDHYYIGTGSYRIFVCTTGVRRKKRPAIMSTTPKYFCGLSNLSPKINIAAKDSTNALQPSHIAFTYKTCEFRRERRRNMITPIYPTTPMNRELRTECCAYSLSAKSPRISESIRPPILNISVSTIFIYLIKYRMV